ncbi:MAG: signal peptidase I [Gemmatimonadaceae bacterium]
MASKKKNGKPKNLVAAAREGGSATKPRIDPKRLWEGVKSLAVTIAIFLVLRTFFVEAYRIPSGSMMPAMLVGDWLFVNKLRYGPHLPFTKVRLPGYAEPRRGEIVVFISPVQVDQPWDPTPIVVKRLIGMPGDTVHSREGVVHINGDAQQLGYAVAGSGAPGDEYYPLFDWQRRIAVADSRFGPPPERPTLDDWGPLVVPEGHYWMMGDSRYNSKDSRYWGVVPRENVRGRPLFVYFSYNANDSDRPLPFITDIRWSRLGHILR